MDSRFNLTKVRLANLKMKGTTLKKLASQFVANNIGFYLDHQQGGRTHSLKFLPQTVRQYLLDELETWTCDDRHGNEETFELRMKVVQLLLSAETRTFDMNWPMRFCLYTGHPIAAVLQMIATGATKISALAFNHRVPCRQIDRTIGFNSDMKSAVLNMSSLNQLQLTKCPIMSLSDVLDICQSLPNLTHLEVSLLSKNSEFDDVPALRISLQKLRVFCFEVFKELEPEEDEVVKKRLAVACLLNLPNLDIIGHHATKNCEAHFILKPTQLVSPRSLRHLAIDADHPFTPEQYQMLPNVTDLKVKWNNELVGSPGYCEFAKVETLYMVRVPSEEIWLSYGHSYGQNLHTLIFQSISFRLSFGELFTLCPNLQILQLYGVKLQDELQLHDPNYHYDHLKAITIHSPQFENKIKLSKILSAPKLEKVCLTYIQLEKRDLMRMAALVQHQAMFSQLKTIELKPRKMKSGRYKAFCQFVKNICAYAPNLVKINFNTFMIDMENAAVLSSSDEDMSGGAEIDQLKDFISAAFR